jgi:hypothetical protein
VRPSELEPRTNGIRHPGAMKIEGAPGQQLSTAHLWLARSEASELRDALTDMLESSPDPNWHVHVPAADYGAELTLSWEISPGGPSAPNG